MSDFDQQKQDKPYAEFSSYIDTYERPKNHHKIQIQDQNKQFRNDVLEAVLAEPEKASIDLLQDLVDVETRAAKIGDISFQKAIELVSILLDRTGAAELGRLIDMVGISMDLDGNLMTELTLDPKVRAKLISRIKDRMDLFPDPDGNPYLWKLKFVMQSVERAKERN